MVIQFRRTDAERSKKNSPCEIAPDIIAPPKEVVAAVLAPEHAAEPIKSMEDIDMVCEYLIGQERYRDYMLFVVGINFGLRAGDLRLLRFSNLINENLTFRDRFALFERKTRNTRKRRKNRYLSINSAVQDAVVMYLEHTPDVSLSDYMFRSLSNNGASSNTPLSIRSIDRILKSIAADLKLQVKMSTHTLRKTFCYHQMVMSNNDHRKLLLLQKMLGHSSPGQTLDYIGITSEEIDEAYRALNLGSSHNYLVAGNIEELEEEIG